MFATTAGASPTVVAAIITGVLIVLGGILTPAWAWMLNKRVGKPDPAMNGTGTLNAMVAATLTKVGGLEERLDNQDERIEVVVAKLDHLDDCLDAVKKRGER